MTTLRTAVQLHEEGFAQSAMLAGSMVRGTVLQPSTCGWYCPFRTRESVRGAVEAVRMSAKAVRRHRAFVAHCDLGISPGRNPEFSGDMDRRKLGYLHQSNGNARPGVETGAELKNTADKGKPKVIGDNPRCENCNAFGSVTCHTCNGSGRYIEPCLESQGVIVRVQCLGCGGEGRILCVSCGGRGHH